MRLVVRLLGVEVLAIEAGPGLDDPVRVDDLGSTPVGFTASPGDQRWERSPDLS